MYDSNIEKNQLQKNSHIKLEGYDYASYLIITIIQLAVF